MITDFDKKLAEKYAKAFSVANRFTIATNGNHKAEMDAFEDGYLSACVDKNTQMIAFAEWIFKHNMYLEADGKIHNHDAKIVATTEELLTIFLSSQAIRQESNG